MKYTFKFKLFGGNVQMFSEGLMGVVIEKEPQVICVYGTDERHQSILCAVPLCHPKYLRGEEYTVDFCEDERVRVSVGEIQLIIDFGMKKCAVNKAIRCYGSEHWGEDVQIDWSSIQ